MDASQTMERVLSAFQAALLPAFLQAPPMLQLAIVVGVVYGAYNWLTDKVK